MAPLRDRIEAEMENIERSLSEMPEGSKIPNLSALELAGVAALLHNFYNGIENIVKQIMQSAEIEIPKGESWHRDLINLAIDKKFISATTAKELQRYLAFRHFFSHAYALDLNADYIESLVGDSKEVYAALKKEIEKHL